MSDENVYQFPPETNPPELLLGPITYNQVIVGGRSIPKLTGYSHLGAETKDQPYAPQVMSIEGAF